MLLLVLVISSSCKKTYIVNEFPANVGTPTDVKPSQEEYTTVSDSEILSNQWTLVSSYAYSINNVRVWKYKSGNKVVIIDNVPSELFWHSAFQIGSVISGEELLRIKKNNK